MTATAARSISERDLQGQIIELARLMKWKVYFTWRSLHSPAGFPDLVLVRPPRLIFAELKSEKGKLTAAQDDWLGHLERVAGAEVYLWRPSCWEEIAEILR